MRVSEASLVAPILVVCWMGVVARDQQDTPMVQYVFGFVAAGASLLTPLDAMGMASQVDFPALFFFQSRSSFFFSKIEKRDGSVQ
jgi:membrane-associated PAP2 superfamily phosphatase